MSQVIDPVPSNSPDQIICCYVNATSKMQVARVTNVPSWYFERVVFPGQRLIFSSLPTAQLEIHTGMMASAILSDIIPCDRLIIQEGFGPALNQAPEEQQRFGALNGGLPARAQSPLPAIKAS